MQCKLYGLQFQNKNDDEKVKTLMKNSKPGEIIFLQDIRPKYVLIKVDRDKIVSNIPETYEIVEVDNDTPTNSQNEKDDSIDALDNVTLTKKQKEKEKYFIFPIPESTYPEDVTIGKCTIKVYGFPFSTEFLRTLNKLQGATKDTILLNLNQRPPGLGNLPLTALTVALSRVKKGDDFAILPLDDDSSLDYLLKLKMSDSVKKLINSIDEDTGFINVNKLVETSSDINFDGSLKIKKSVTNKKKTTTKELNILRNINDLKFGTSVNIQASKQKTLSLSLSHLQNKSIEEQIQYLLEMEYYPETVLQSLFKQLDNKNKLKYQKDLKQKQQQIHPFSYYDKNENELTNYYLVPNNKLEIDETLKIFNAQRKNVKNYNLDNITSVKLRKQPTLIKILSRYVNKI